jgi:dienelactone hydrolase
MRIMRVPACLLTAALGAGATIGAASTAPRVPQESADSSAATRAAFLKLIDRPRVPLAPEVRSRTDADLTAEDLSFAVQAGERVPTLLIKRQDASGRRPVVIVLHGTGGNKEGLAGRLRELAKRGFIGVAIDGRYHGARATQRPGQLPPYPAAILDAYRTMGEHPFLYDTVWDVMRLIDYLVTRDDVDSRRIGLTGISKGGMETYLAAAVDPRVAVAVPMIGVQSFRWALEHGAWDSRAWTLREAIDAAAKDGNDNVGAGFMRRFYDRVAPGLYREFDGPAMLPLIAPRPLLAVNGDSDPRTPIGGVRECMAAAERAYKAHGVPERLMLHLQPNAGHQITARRRSRGARLARALVDPLSLQLDCRERPHRLLHQIHKSG